MRNVRQRKRSHSASSASSRRSRSSSCESDKENLAENCERRRQFAKHCNELRRNSSDSGCCDTCARDVLKTENGHFGNGVIQKNGTILDGHSRECDGSVSDNSEANGRTSSENDHAASKDSVSWYHKLLPYSWIWEPEYVVVKSRSQAQRNQMSEIHHQTDSLLSTSSGFNNYRGLLNLCIVLLVLSNARVALENIIKYGILVDPIAYVTFFLAEPYTWPCLCLLISCNIFIFNAYGLEKLLAKKSLSEGFARGLHIINLLTMLIYPAAAILILHPNPFFSMQTLACFVISFCKLISYVVTNRWCRLSQRKDSTTGRRRYKSMSATTPPNSEKSVSSGQQEATLVQYPDNLNVNDLYYFMFAPTLCYELNFPRSARIRKRFLFKRVVEMVFLSQIMLGLIQQWIVPTVKNSMVPFVNSEFSRIVERLLKLAVPNHFIWLIFFYCFFHSMLNVLAEVLRFGDREFYRDWWNCEDVNTFWSHWNIPVHRWARRHLYIPMVQSGFSKMQAGITVFFVSAFFHEYLVSVPLNMFRLWAFFAMLGQVPFAIFVKKFLHGQYGNMAMWVSLIVGQPIAILMYFHDYYILH